MVFDRRESAAYLAGLLAKEAARALQARARQSGFAPGQLPVLLELWAGDGLTQRQLLDRLDIEQATMANTLARMERDGLITRSPHPNDKRAQLIHLSERGQAMRADALAAAEDAESELFRGFRKFEKELLLEYMRMMIANIARDTRS
ncbi:MarR family winged helix-turn-helix transcriptional regulator [Mycoplana rhizolycopersici]|jgi:DNA-binding MarR family transcriptional regulator|uniref:MarR family transcriptional regulator n=1 Tax=Mycoplana rhizolycopersici TaxID=2746702 RepID=A0ABX2QG79_9HYPH|nr:MarR family transcriptional regulator [Rhizobium rhizolycopersici]NVP56772.1 MarR family transcriptional regulator [Rhizobium rhizolycopersici]